MATRICENLAHSTLFCGLSTKTLARTQSGCLKEQNLPSLYHNRSFVCYKTSQTQSMATTWTVEQRYFNRRKIERWFRSLGKEKCTYSVSSNPARCQKLD